LLDLFFSISIAFEMGSLTISRLRLFTLVANFMFAFLGCLDIYLTLLHFSTCSARCYQISV
jgi:hypothetical protein